MYTRCIWTTPREKGKNEHKAPTIYNQCPIYQQNAKTKHNPSPQNTHTHTLQPTSKVLKKPYFTARPLHSTPSKVLVSTIRNKSRSASEPSYIEHPERCLPSLAMLLLLKLVEPKTLLLEKKPKPTFHIPNHNG